MRFILVVLIWIVIVGGLWGYTARRDAAVKNLAAATPVDISVSGSFSLEITPTFAAEDDPFALQAEDSDASAFEIRLNGEIVNIADKKIERGIPIRIDFLEGLLSGHNELFVRASPPVSDTSMSHGVRLQLFEGGSLIVDKTVWSSTGALVSGSVSFSYGISEESSHDH